MLLSTIFVRNIIQHHKEADILVAWIIITVWIMRDHQNDYWKRDVLFHPGQLHTGANSNIIASAAIDFRM